MSDIVLKTENLTKTFKDKVAVSGVSMQINRGEIYGFIGKNGAGKTTFMRLVLGMAFPTDGSIELFGEKPNEKNLRKVGSLIETPSLYTNCSAKENLIRECILCGENVEKANELLETVGLQDVGNKKVKAFSLGMKQRLGIAMALVNSPEFLILDEPVNGLDPLGIKEVRELILKLNKEKGITFLISSHLLDELSKIVTKYGIINNGVLVEEIEKTAKESNNVLRLTVSDTEKAIEILKQTNYRELYIKNGKIIISAEEEKQLEIGKLLFENGVIVYGIENDAENDEDYFIEKMGG